MWCLFSALHLVPLLLQLQFHYLSAKLSQFLFFFSHVTVSIQNTCNDVNVVFFFSNSLTAFAPSSPIPLSVHHSIITLLYYLSVSVCYSCSPPKFSKFTLVFDFKASLNTSAPEYPIPCSVYQPSSVTFILFIILDTLNLSAAVLAIPLFSNLQVLEMLYLHHMC